MAAEYLRKRIKGVEITAHTCKIQALHEQDHSFFSKFMVIIAGLDNVAARIWLNHLVVQNKTTGVSSQLLLDGGTDADLGVARLVIPFETPCYQCITSP